MKKLLKSTALTLAVMVFLSSTAFASANLFPVRETFEAKGYNVSWIQETKTVVLSDGGFKVEEPVGEAITLDYDKTYASEAFVENVENLRKAYEEYSTNATVTEIGEGYFLADTEKLGEVMFKFDDKTFFKHEMNRRLYRADDLTVGANLKVYFDIAMTASIPPQTYAIEVVFLNSVQVEERLTMTGEVIETGENFVLVNTENMGEVMFMFDENTNLHHEMNRMFYAFTDLTEGMLVTVYPSEAMTASLPPQTYAHEIVILNVEEPDTVTYSGTITELGEDYFILTSENSTHRFNCDESTNIHHIMNRRLYRFGDLEKDMSVEVIAQSAATFSLPPQSYAIEVIIK